LAIPKEISKEIELDFSNVPREELGELKSDIAELIVDEIKIKLAKGESPVQGESFDPLSEEYAKKEKNGNRRPNLNLEGDLWDSLEAKFDGNKLVVGVFDSKEVPKADGHNNFSGESKLPQRRFIPSEDQSFRPEIMRKINILINERRETEQDRDVTEDFMRVARGGRIAASTITINEVIGARIIDDLLDSIFEL
jgi:hypothetical protein